MSHHHHSFANKKLGKQPKHASGHLPGSKFGALVGKVDHLTLSPHDGKKADDNHVYIWIAVPSGPQAGKYECAFNTESTAGDHSTSYLVYEEEITPADVPAGGFENASMSYTGLGWKESDFSEIDNGSLRTAVYNWADSCIEIAAYGFTYNDGTGIHDIHMNSGEKPGSPFPNKVNEDGALAFYYRQDHGNPYRRWVFIKFGTQQLPA